MKFDFNFGNKKKSIYQYAITGVILTTIIAGLSQCTHIKETIIWDLLDEIQRKYFPQSIINDFVIKDPERLDRRIKRDIDRAIDAATPEYNRIIREADKKYQPRYIDLKNDDKVCYSNGCKSLAPPMRLCSPFTEGIDCSNN